MSKTYRKPKIALAGGGNIGGTIASYLMKDPFADVVIMDIMQGIPVGKGLDICQAGAAEGKDPSIYGSNDFSEMKGADVVVVTAGSPRKPGMSRSDLLLMNAGVMADMGKKVAEYCPDAFVIVVTNPLDAMVWTLQKASKLPAEKIVGMAGILDSSRLKFFLAQELNVAASDVQGFVIGGHGDTMVPMFNYTTISGIPLQTWIDMKMISKERVQEIFERTKTGGGEIVELYQQGSAYFAPANSVMMMIKSYLFNQRKVLPCAAYLNGEYGLKDMYFGVPVVIGKSGVEKIIELPLTEEEKSMVKESAKSVEELITTLKENTY